MIFWLEVLLLFVKVKLEKFKFVIFVGCEGVVCIVVFKFCFTLGVLVGAF